MHRSSKYAGNKNHSLGEFLYIILFPCRFLSIYFQFSYSYKNLHWHFRVKTKCGAANHKNTNVFRLYEFIIFYYNIYDKIDTPIHYKNNAKPQRLAMGLQMFDLNINYMNTATVTRSQKL